MLYFTHMPRSPQWMDFYQIWFRGSSHGRAECSQLMGFDSVRGQNSPSPIDLAGRR